MSASRTAARRLRPTRIPRLVWVAVAMAVAGALLLPLAVSATHAMFTDEARMTASFDGAFALGAIGGAERVSVDESGAVHGSFAPSSAFVPGATAVLPMDVFNNSREVTSNVSLDMSAVGEVAHLLRFSVVWTDESGSHVIVGDPAAPDTGASIEELAGVDLGALAPRRSAILTDGDVWTGPASSRATVSVHVHLLDAPETRELRGASTTLTMTVVGKSP